MTRFWLGKTLELIGISTLGLALCFGMLGRDMKLEYLYFGVGGALFVAGYLLERPSRAK